MRASSWNAVRKLLYIARRFAVEAHLHNVANGVVVARSSSLGAGATMAHPDCPFRAEGRCGGVASPTERDPAWRGMDHLDASTDGDATAGIDEPLEVAGADVGRARPRTRGPDVYSDDVTGSASARSKR